MSIKRGVPLHDYSYCILSEQRITPVCCYYWGHLRRDVLQLTEKEHVEVSEKWDRAHYRLKYPVDEDVSQTNQLSSGPDWRIQRCVWSLWVNTWIIQETPSVSTMLSHIWTIINSDVCLEPHCSVEAVSHCDPTSRHLDCVGHRDTDRHTPVVKSVFCLVCCSSPASICCHSSSLFWAWSFTPPHLPMWSRTRGSTSSSGTPAASRQRIHTSSVLKSPSRPSPTPASAPRRGTGLLFM